MSLRKPNSDPDGRIALEDSLGVRLGVALALTMIFLGINATVAAIRGEHLLTGPEPEQVPAAQASAAPYQEQRSVGPLDGLVLYLSAGHGRLLHLDRNGRVVTFDYQRTLKHQIREDVWTAAFVTELLAPRIEALGATVIALRERDTHAEREVVDDASLDLPHGQRMPWTGAWGGAVTLLPAGASLDLSLEAPENGIWYAYLQQCAAPDHDAALRIDVTSPRDGRTLRVDQTRHDAVPWPLGSYQLFAGETLDIHLEGSGVGAVCLDALRLGGGTLDTLEDGTPIPPTPAWELAALHQAPLLGGPASLWRDDGRRVTDPRFRGHWVAWTARHDPDAAFLSIHTNAGKGRGTLLFHGVESDPPIPPHPGSLTLGEAINTELDAALHAVDPKWPYRGLQPGDYSEISPLHNGLPAVLIELGFHDNAKDAISLRDPTFQRAAADAIVAGLVRWHLQSP